MTRNVYWSRPSVCLSLVACPHYSTDPDVTWGMVEGDGSARCARSVIYDCLVMAAHSNGQAIILLPYGSFYLLLLSFALALSQRPQIGCLSYFYTWRGSSANLECRYEMCCARLTGNAGPKKSPSGHHSTNLSGYIFATKARIDNRKKPVKQQCLPHMFSQW